MKLRIFSFMICAVAFSSCYKCYTCTREEECYEYYYYDISGNKISSGVHCIADYNFEFEYTADKDYDHDHYQMEANAAGAIFQGDYYSAGTTEKELCGKSTGMSGMNLQDDVDDAELEGYQCLSK